MCVYILLCKKGGGKEPVIETSAQKAGSIALLYGNAETSNI